LAEAQSAEGGGMNKLSVGLSVSRIKSLHKLGLIEFDRELNYIHLSPIGIKEVERKILSK